MRDARLAALERQRERPDILVKKQEDIDLVCRLVSSVTAWLQVRSRGRVGGGAEGWSAAGYPR